MLKMTLNNKDLSELLKSIGNMDKGFEKVIKNGLNEAGNKVLAKAIFRTPVGQYKGGKVGGTLRQGWEISAAKKYKNGYSAYVFNDVEYATYVEYGHFTRNRKKFIDGRYMLTKSIDEVDIEQILLSKIGAVINND